MDINNRFGRLICPKCKLPTVYQSLIFKDNRLRIYIGRNLHCWNPNCDFEDFQPNDDRTKEETNESLCKKDI